MNIISYSEDKWMIVFFFFWVGIGPAMSPGPAQAPETKPSQPPLTPSSAYGLSPSLLFFGIIILVTLKFYWLSLFLYILCFHPHVIWFRHCQFMEKEKTIHLGIALWKKLCVCIVIDWSEIYFVLSEIIYIWSFSFGLLILWSKLWNRNTCELTSKLKVSGTKHKYTALYIYNLVYKVWWCNDQFWSYILVSRKDSFLILMIVLTFRPKKKKSDHRLFLFDSNNFYGRLFISYE